MTVNLKQYHWTVGVFNNRKLPLKKTDGPFLQKKTFEKFTNWNSDDSTCTYSNRCNLS